MDKIIGYVIKAFFFVYLFLLVIMITFFFFHCCLFDLDIERAQFFYLLLNKSYSTSCPCLKKVWFFASAVPHPEKWGATLINYTVLQ